MKTAQSGNGNQDVDYLLGQLDGQERDAVREGLLNDADAFDRLREAENELFDAYARGTLLPGQRAAFEQTLLRQPDAAAKLQASRALMAAAAPGRSSLRWWYVPAAIAAAASAFFLREMPRRVEPAPPAVVRTAAAVVRQSFRLMPAMRGAPAKPELVLAPATNEMEFVAPLPAGPPAAQYEVALERESGGAVWTAQVPAAGGELRWHWPALAPGAYVIRVGTVADPLAFFEVSVARR